MNAETAMVNALKDIVKELHEINRKLTRMTNSDIFTKTNTSNEEEPVSFFFDVLEEM